VGLIKEDRDDDWGYANSAFKCVSGGNDKWVDADVSWHKDTVHRNQKDENALYYLYNSKGVLVNNGGVKFNGKGHYAQNGQIRAQCLDGYEVQNNNCVKTYQKACEDSGGAWENGECKCSEIHNLVFFDLTSACKCKDFYERNSDNKCVLKAEVAELKNTCEATAGSWNLEKNKCECDESNNLVSNADNKTCECKSSDFEFIAQDKKCVSKKDVCETSFGVWDDQGQCSCSPEKGLKQDISKNKCVCENTEYVVNKEQEKCTPTDEELDCIVSFGEWKNKKCECNASKNLVVDNSTGWCICTDSNYERDDENKICVKKASFVEQEKCKADSNAEWTENDGCVCKLSKHQWGGEKCADTDEYTSCVAASDTLWEDQKGCTCTDITKVWSKDGNACVDSPETIKRNKATAAEAVINEVSADFNELIKDLDVSKWKSSDGKFNVVRLASDSIAGVVLGTASGLITSTVVKKSQAKKGLENIQCEIGGTVVADYGDEFRVGKQ
jgi:hypothetical protein